MFSAICWCANDTSTEVVVQGLQQGCNTKEGPSRVARLYSDERILHITLNNTFCVCVQYLNMQEKDV